METHIISKSIVTPSSPTPPHRKIFNLSLLDQLIPAPYAPIVLFYPNSTGLNHAQILKRVEKLKASLSETLTLFFPLAGTIRDDLTIECNDNGAYVATAKVNCQLFQFLKRPDLELICKFLPCDVGFVGSMVGTRVTNVQVNLFECGGMAIGICISHRILDGAALNRFLHGWAAEAVGGGGEEVPGPDFAGSELFPASDLWLRDSAMEMWGASFKAGSSVTKRFVFDSPAIAKLKSMAAGSDRSNPTRVEAISAFLWKSIITTAGSHKPSMLTHVVNLRKRADSDTALSEHSIGNLVWISGAKAPEVTSLPALADAVQSSISKINADYIKKMHGNDGSGLMRKALQEIADFGSGSGSGESVSDYLAFSSWCGFDFYGVDFGWGKPVWVSSYAMSAPVFLNLVILMETKYGGGIEAWVTLDEQEIEALVNDRDFLDFVTVDPSPLEMGYSGSERFIRESDKSMKMIRDCKSMEETVLKFVNV